LVGWLVAGAFSFFFFFFFFFFFVFLHFSEIMRALDLMERQIVTIICTVRSSSPPALGCCYG